MFRYALILLVLTACSSWDYDKDMMKPLEANMYEGHFSYNCNGRIQEAAGSASCQYDTGDKLEIVVFTPPTTGQISVRSCQVNRTIEINKKTSRKISISLESRDYSCPITVALGGVDVKTSMFKFYPYVFNSDYPRMDLKYKIDRLGHGTGVGSLSAPIGRILKMQVTPKEDGIMMATSTGCEVIQETTVRDVYAGKMETITIKGDNLKYCILAVAIKYEDEYEESEIYIDWFDGAYVPLVKPNRKGSRLCRPHGARWFIVDGKSTKKCRKGKRATAWTKIGRSSSVYE